MVRDLLALLIALQDVELDDNQHRSLRELSNKCASFVRRKASADDWQNIQAKLRAILAQHPELERHSQSIKSKLQPLSSEELQKLLPSPELITLFKLKSPETLGHLPGPFFPKGNEITNIAVEIENAVMELMTIILRQEKPSNASRELVSTNNKKELNKR